MGTWGTIYSNITYTLAEHSRQIAWLQEQIASGSRVLRASNAPADAYRILHLRSQAVDFETYRKNLSTVSLSLEQVSTVLSDLSDSLTRVRQTMTQAASGTYGQKDRLSLAEEVDALLEKAVSNANLKHLGRYLFAGGDAEQAPYAVTRVDGEITSVTYQGTLSRQLVPVAPGVDYSAFVVGEDVFGQNQRQTPLFLGSTGAAPGTGTSSVRGDVWAELTHTATLYNDPTNPGVAAGTSAAQDTILGEHTLFISFNGTSGTIQLDSGPAVTITGTEADVALTAPDGTVAHIDVTGLAGVTFQGTNTILGQGKVTIDGGKSYTDITSFGGTVAVTDADTGRVLYVDTMNLRRTGLEPVRVPGTGDLFGTLISIRNALRNDRALTDSEQAALIRELAVAAEELHGTISQSMTSVGARLAAVDNLDKSLEDIQATAEAQADSLQEADVVQVATELARAQAFYEMTLATASKVLTTSLLDYI